MDDVDSVQAQIARNMLVSGDWVTARLDGVPYLEKPPLIYWTIALTYKIFGVHDWSARIPMALSALALCWVTAAFGVWAFGKRAGFYAGLCIATCVGLFLFTRVLIPDVMLTFTTALRCGPSSAPLTPKNLARASGLFYSPRVSAPACF
jgi:4-amino-4-deoxy-L-arabinose transferase-like glycosyltransferase